MEKRTMPRDWKVLNITEASKALHEAKTRYEEQRDLLLDASGEKDAIRVLSDLAEARADAEFAALFSLIEPFYKQGPKRLRQSLHRAAKPRT
jgi:hypothetical protein